LLESNVATVVSWRGTTGIVWMRTASITGSFLWIPEEAPPTRRTVDVRRGPGSQEPVSRGNGTGNRNDTPMLERWKLGRHGGMERPGNLGFQAWKFISRYPVLGGARPNRLQRKDVQFVYVSLLERVGRW